MSDDEKTAKIVDQTEDPELDILLNSALEDFAKTSKAEAKKDESSTAAVSSMSETSEEPVPDDKLWTDDFVEHAVDKFRKNMENLMENGEGSEIGALLQRMAENSAITDVSPDFQNAISQALEDLTAKQEEIQSRGGDFPDGDLAEMIEKMSFEEGAGEFLPFMQGMMQSLLSKEVLYPSLKELVEKYPKWLEEKKETLPQEELVRFTKQLELMQKVCSELETEKEDDGADVKKRRFDKTLILMQDMQTYGHPPDELVKDQPPLFPSDSSGNPMMPSFPLAGDPQNCCVM